MIRMMVELRVKAGEVEAVETALRAYVGAVHKHEPLTELQAFRRGAEPVYVQVMGFPDEETAQRHRRCSYTRRFMEEVMPRCETDPQAIPLTLIG
ncbi:MAG TPA: antibiotic biosynthesis monooxygenase [Polyangia bacterium]|jgi:quinol monooxygenase YgiN